MTDTGLVPLINFGEVFPNLFRSAQPEYMYQYAWLSDILKVTRIYNLRAESEHDERYAHKMIPWEGRELGFEVIDIPVEDHHPPIIAQAREFIKAIKNDIIGGEVLTIEKPISWFDLGDSECWFDLGDPESVGFTTELTPKLKTPTLIHCAYGHGRTSVFSVLAKMAAGMSLDESIQDEKTRFHYQFRHPEQEQWLRDNSAVLLKP